jgi:hypothetical protein
MSEYFYSLGMLVDRSEYTIFECGRYIAELLERLSNEENM